MTDRALVGVDMAGEDEIDLVLDEPGFEHDPHGLPLHVVVVVAVVPRRVQEHDKPWRQAAVHSRELLLQPIVLRRVLACGKRKE